MTLAKHDLSSRAILHQFGLRKYVDFIDKTLKRVKKRIGLHRNHAFFVLICPCDELRKRCRVMVIHQIRVFSGLKTKTKQIKKPKQKH